MRVRISRLKFHPGLWPTLVVLIMLALLLSLGFWQLERADQKRALLEAYGDSPDDAPVRVTADFSPGRDWRFRRAMVEGVYDSDHQFLLDNRVYQGRVGYHVLTPLRLADSDAVILVNRGWVPQGATRDDLPALPITHRSMQKIEGLIDFQPEWVFVLGEGEDRAPGWPKVLQQIRLDLQAAQLGETLSPIVLLLAQDQSDGFVRDWRPVVFGPEKHVGYAVQWFSLAAVLLVLYLWVSLHRSESDADTGDSSN